MPRPKIDAADRRTLAIRVRVSPRERERLDAAAEALGVGVSELMRSAGLARRVRGYQRRACGTAAAPATDPPVPSADPDLRAAASASDRPPRARDLSQRDLPLLGGD